MRKEEENFARWLSVTFALLTAIAFVMAVAIAIFEVSTV